MILTPSIIAKYYDKYNKEYFLNSLPSCSFDTMSSKDWLGTYQSTAYDNFDASNQRILMSDLFDWEEYQIRDILIHEMIHCYLNVNQIDQNLTHGVQFKRMANWFNKRWGMNIDIKYDLDNFKPLKKKKISWFF